ncbi:hypothetical protein BDZ97DRAFT_1754546 [Flammula alnicola]|nr:hypothetical protein BDZ97DRAFT_1754546 [Flammula alnicola]
MESRDLRYVATSPKLVCLQSVWSRMGNHSLGTVEYLKFKVISIEGQPCGKVKYLHQSATFTAFGNPVFDKPIENIAAIYAIFKRAIGDNLVEGDVCSTYEDFSAIDVVNRYFTPRGGAASEEIRPLTTEVDPKGYLERQQAPHMCTQKKTSFRATGQQIFQVGDILKVQVSFIAIPMRDNKWKVRRSISLFDGRFIQEAIMKSLIPNTAPVENAKPLLKRRVGYREEEVSITRAKLTDGNRRGKGQG